MRWVLRAGMAGLAGAAVVAGGLSPSLHALSRPARGPVAQAQPTAEGKHAPTTRYLTEAQCVATPAIRIPCYEPAQFQEAYDVRPLFKEGITGAGQTIAVVDSFGSPTIRHDLATFDAKFHLPPPPSLRVIQPAGRVPAFNPTSTTMVGWAGETTLDVEWAHAMAPGAAILVVETPVAETEGTTGFPQIVAAEKDVVDHHLADVISQSFGATETTFPATGALLSLRGAFLAAAKHSVTVLAAAGDTGATDYSNSTATAYSTAPTVTWPASDPLVTAVGGTELSLLQDGRRVSPDRAWNDTYDPVVDDYLNGTPGARPDAGGGGLSSVFSRPSYQDGVAGLVGDRRGIPDISMSGACSGLADTYQSFPGQAAGWYFVCGTSEATPLFAGVVALADQMAGHPLGLLNPAIYAMSAAHEPGIVDVTKGDNTVSFTQTATERTVDGYAAGPGYDLASGVGTVDAARFVPELVRAVAAVGGAVSYGIQPGSS